MKDSLNIDISNNCPVELTLRLISNKWKILILRDLISGPQRFSELRRSIGSISQKVLTSNLRDMEKNNIITRTIFPEVPPRVEYELTELGYSLKTVLISMQNWGNDYKKIFKNQNS